MHKSKSPFCHLAIAVGACGNSVLMPIPTSLTDLATISQAVFQSVQPVGVINFQPPSLVPSGSS